MNGAAANGSESARLLAGPGLCLRTGPITCRLQLELPELTAGVAGLYADYPLVDPAATIVDYQVRLAACRPSRRLQRQARLLVDGQPRFQPFPRQAAMAHLEWGLNHVVTRNRHGHLALHAAALERAGRAIIITGPSGSGKSTLAAALMFSGWRLLAEELTLVDIATGLIAPVPRPVCLKDRAIARIRAAFPAAAFGPPATETRKGDIVHVKPPAEHVRRMDTPAPVAAIFCCSRDDQPGPARWTTFPKARALMQAITCSFNYRYLGAAGFECLGALIDRAACHTLVYHDAVEAAAQIGAAFCTAAGREPA